MVLSNQYTWEELCEYNISRVRKGLKDEREVKLYRKFFLEREKVGWVFDHFAVFKSFKIWKELNDDYDHFTIVTGREGSGKSTFAIQLASWVCPNFTNKDLLEDIKSYRQRLKQRTQEVKELKKQGKKPELMALVFDEGIELLSKEHHKKDHVDLLKSLIVQRRLHVFVIICVPNFFFLETSIRQHRVRSLFHIYQRSHYKYFTNGAVKIVADAAAKHKDVLKVKLPEDQFEYGDHRKALPKTFDWDKYDDWKLDKIEQNVTDTEKPISDNGG